MIEGGQASRHMRRGLISLISLFAHFYFVTEDQQPQSSIGTKAGILSGN